VFSYLISDELESEIKVSADTEVFAYFYLRNCCYIFVIFSK